MFTSIIESGLTLSNAVICTAVSIGLGILISVCYTFRSNFTRSFATTLVLLPAIVQAVIMMVNGNIGTGVAVLGAFSLIRFRSVPGTSREICVIFLAMAVGIATGIGQVWFAALFTLLACILLIFLKFIPLKTEQSREKSLKIVLSEDMDYMNALDDVFSEFTAKHTLEKVRTTNMGSMFELNYHIVLKDERRQKEMIDSLRTKNGNLPITVSVYRSNFEEL